jgi:hypothetical protein
MVFLATLVLTLGATPVAADDAGPGPGTEPSDTASDDEEDDDDDKGCAHMMMPQNLAVLGTGLLVFVVASRRGGRQD